jgi:RHS repeat-associated protein
MEPTIYLSRNITRISIRKIFRKVNFNKLTDGADIVRKRFTGYERDNEIGLDYAQARYFSSGFGRFSSPDDFSNDTTVRAPQSWNLYVYVRNNPLNYVDPTGKEIWVLFEEEEEYEEDGEKKKRIVTRYAQYRDGKLWSDFSNGVEYAGDNKHARKIQSDLNDIVAKGGAGEIKRLVEDTLFHGVGHRDFGSREIRGETDPVDGGKAIWERGDTKSGSMTYYDTQTAESDSNGITAASLARELLGPATDFANADYTNYDPHRYRIYSDVQGTHYQRSEVWRMQIDDRARRDFGLPSREFFGGERVPKGSIVCEWAIRNGSTSCK